MTISVSREMNWNDIKKNSWAGAVSVCERIEEQGREEEAMNLIAEVFYDEIPDEMEVNDFIWFDLADMLHLDDYDEEGEM